MVTKTTAKKIELAERRAEAVTLRKKGLSYRSIAKMLSISPAQVVKDVKRELSELREQTRADVEELRQLELERLDAVQQFVSNQLVGDDVLPAVDRWLKISERRAKLLGLDAPIQIQVQQQVENQIDEFIQFLEDNISTEAFNEVMSALQSHAAAHENAIAN